MFPKLPEYNSSLVPGFTYKEFERWFLFLYLTNQKEITLTAPGKTVLVELLGGNETTAHSKRHSKNTKNMEHIKNI